MVKVSDKELALHIAARRVATNYWKAIANKMLTMDVREKVLPVEIKDILSRATTQ